MPQLPSGIHVVIDTLPLHELMENWQSHASMAVLAKLNAVEDMYPLTRILELVPSQEAVPPMKLASSSLTPPENMKPRDTGYRLSDALNGLPEWTAPDRAAFRSFVLQRVRPQLEMVMTNVLKRYKDLEKDYVTRLLETFKAAGVHPSQEPGWDDWPDKPEVDMYDQLAALLVCCYLVVAADVSDKPSGPSVDRLYKFIAFAASTLPQFSNPDVPAESQTELADAMRNAIERHAMDPGQREWWKTQIAVECRCLFNDDTLEPFLQKHAPQAYGIIRLSAISRLPGLPH